MYKVAVIGDRDSIYGFASAGLEIHPVLTAQQGWTQIQKLVNDNYGVLYITESLYQKLEPQLEVYKEETLPAIIPIPGVSENTGLGLANVRKSVERAVGSDILFGGK